MLLQTEHKLLKFDPGVGVRRNLALSGTFKDSENQGYICNPLLFCLLAISAVYHKSVKYVTKTCENLFVQIQWFNCPVTLLYSICRTLYVIV